MYQNIRYIYSRLRIKYHSCFYGKQQPVKPDDCVCCSCAMPYDISEGMNGACNECISWKGQHAWANYTWGSSKLK